MYYESSSKLEVKDGKPIKALMKILPHGPYFSFQSQLHATLLRKYLQTLQVISKTSKHGLLIEAFLYSIQSLFAWPSVPPLFFC